MAAQGNVLYFFYSFQRRETFATAAKYLLNQIWLIQRKHPGAKRGLFLTIQGHQKKGKYDSDAFILQTIFLAKFLVPYLTHVLCPLAQVLNDNQRDDVPDSRSVDFEKACVVPIQERMARR